MSHYSNEIQIEIDDVYGCPGSCPGCVLTKTERKNNKPDMSKETLVNSIQKLCEYVPTLANLEKINLTYGIADHFLMSKEYLEFTFREGSKLIRAANLQNPHNGIFYTASMIGKHNLIMEKVNFLHKLSKEEKVPFYVIAVLDPKNLYRKNFGDVYKDNIISTNSLIGRVDLSINLSEEAVTMITPRELYDFAKMNNFDEVTINWVPTFDNIRFSYANLEKTTRWLIEFDELVSMDEKLGTSYRPVILRTIDNISCTNIDESESLIESIDKNLNELIYKSVQIDENGYIFPKYEAIGDIAHNPRLKLEPIGNINEESSIQELFKNKRKSIQRTINKIMNNVTCINCEYSKYCANSGFHIYNHVLQNISEINSLSMINKNISRNGCFHMGKSIFAHYEKNFKKIVER